jgi:hypothetical protein
MDAALMPLHTRESTMQYRTDIDPTRLSVYDTPCHSLKDASDDGFAALTASMEADGFDVRRPVILVCNARTMGRAGWELNSDDEVTVVQGRHRWLAAQEAALDTIAAVLVTHDEWELLRVGGDANDIELLALANLDALIARADEGEQLGVGELLDVT